MIVTIVGLTPAPRFPPLDTPWTQAQIEEAPTDSGPWTVVEPAFNLNPVPDQFNPQSYDFSTTHATLAAGWYRVTWLDAAANTDSTLPVYNDARLDAFRPTVAQIGSLMRARTKVRGGTELGTFTDNDPPTRPTATQVEAVIDQVLPLVQGDLGAVPDGLLAQARSASIYRIAQEIELGYWPEQNTTDQSLAEQYGALYTAAAMSIIKGVEGDTPGVTFGFGSVATRGLDGQPAVYTVSATLTAASPVVTLDDTSALRHGYPVTGHGVPYGAIVQSVDSATQLTLSLPATVTGVSVLTIVAA